MVERISDTAFTAERRRLRTVNGAETACDGSDARDRREQARHRELLRAISDLRRCIDERAASSIDAGAPLTVVDEALPGLGQLRVEVEQLSSAIDQTKREIAALRRRDAASDKLLDATSELDAVIRATESATEAILAAAEQIDDQVRRLRASASGSTDAEALDDIAERIIRIFESCNFQDITGQRITKVVNTMKFIEGRVERMIAILGGAEAFATLPADAENPDESETDPDTQLMNGPALDDREKVSQADIDKLFD